MAWDAEAKKLAIKTIGTVESNMKYDVIYYVDPITVGIMQWYGTRAAHLLNQIKATPGWTGVAPSLDNDLATQPQDSASFWTNRYLTKAEGSSLKGALTSADGVRIQNAQILVDLEDYAVAARKVGIDPDTNTQAFIFFCVMYHQSPKYSRQVVNSAGAEPSIDRLYSMTMNHSWYSKFKTRYKTALDMIKSGDTSGIPDGQVDPSVDDEGGDSSSDGGVTMRTNISHVMAVGDQIHIRHEDGTTLVCYHAGGQSYKPANPTAGSTAVVDNPNNPTPEVPPGTGNVNAPASIQAMIAFLMDNISAWGYSQGAGRLNPPVSGVGDCSSIVYYVYRRFAGIELGANTRLQQTDGKSKIIWAATSSGQVPPENILRPGDLIYYRWRGGSGGTYGVVHVEFYIGNNQTLGHGGGSDGKRPGPVLANMSALSSRAASSWVRRVLQ